MRVLRFVAILLALPFIPVAGALDRPSPDWVAVDYSALVDRRELSHSGEAVGALLRRLDGRPAPSTGGRAGDGLIHSLLDPLLEPYAFVLPDALDSLTPAAGSPRVEVGSLWRPGEAQPAWAELLRARRYLVESDGRGRLRVCLPWKRGTGEGPPDLDPRVAAQEAWEAAWPVLRLVLAAERRRLTPSGGPAPTLEVELHAYRHLPERSKFWLGAPGLTRTVDNTGPDGRRPPIDIEGLRRFLDAGLQLEGGRLESDGALRLVGSQPAVRPSLLGRPIDLADLAVAYRAVFHGGLAEPYMSLDRGFSPHRAIVNYGGRLRDTGLGLVSLLCDIRFKTFSLGLDILEGRDLRSALREQLPGFRTHIERLAADPGSRDVWRQQTRLWFYPDAVDLTLSAEGDLLAMRKVRMTAASERVMDGSGTAAPAEDPPWTRATVAEIDQDYDRLAGFFPELADLDQVVRLLSLFTWLRRAQSAGNLVPEVDALLDVELPSVPTPRTFSQLLAFNALPEAGVNGPVWVLDRVPIAEALERLNPASLRPLPARRRYSRALAALDREVPEHAELLREAAGQDRDRLDDVALDFQAHRAERLAMHHRVLRTLAADDRAALRKRQEAGETLRVFSVGIGGLDLGMDSALERAEGRRLGLAGELPAGPGGVAPGAGAPGSGSRPQSGAGPPRDEWRRDNAELAGAKPLPKHGLDSREATAGRPPGQDRIDVHPSGPPGPGWIRTVLGADGPEVRSRKLQLDTAGRVALIERAEGTRFVRYRFEAASGGLIAQPVDGPRAGSETAMATESERLPARLALMRVAAPPVVSPEVEPPALRLRIEFDAEGTRKSLEASVPRELLRRVVLGRAVDLTPDRAVPGLSPLPPALSEVTSVMLVLSDAQRTPPWEIDWAPVAGEEDPTRLARALGAWWAEEGESRRAVVGVDPGRSPTRWDRAPRPKKPALLVLPPSGFPGLAAGLRGEIESAWSASNRASELPRDLDAELVVLVSGEAPGEFASRLRELARDPRMAGKLLAAWCVSGPLRQDLAASLLAEGRLAGLGLAEASVLDRRRIGKELEALDRSLRSASTAERRVEALPGPFLWHF